MMGSSIQLAGVSKTYGVGGRATAALRNLTLEIAPGEFVSLMGPSGSGKTTLLNLMAGLDTPSAGRVAVDGMDLGASPITSSPTSGCVRSASSFSRST